MEVFNFKNKYKTYFVLNFILFYISIFLFVWTKTNENNRNRKNISIYKLRRLENNPLNHIININISYLRYINFASYSNGDMILQCGGYPKSDLRFFIGFKNNGRGLFKNDITNEYSYFYSLNISDYYNQSGSRGKYESKNIVIKLSDNNSNKNEYLISLSYSDSYVEIYDFKNGEIYQKHLYDFSKMQYISSYQNMAIPLFSNNSDYYYLFGFIGDTNNTTENKFIIQKHIFKSIINITNENTMKSIAINKKAIYHEKTGFSCFQTEKQIIMCFFLTNDKEYIITAYDIDLQEKKNITLPLTELKFVETFYKCIHLKKEIGIFIYYPYFNNNENVKFFPVLLFKEYQANISDIINYTIPEIIINKINILYDPYIFLNDLIKLNSNKLCLCSTNNGDKNILYIILINLFQDIQYKVRYYSIDIFYLYGYNIHLDLRAYNYNNFIALAFSNHNERIEECKNNNYDRSCIALLILNYPNSTDNYIILDEYLRTEFTIKNININLENDLIFENNIFGYKLPGIKFILITVIYLEKIVTYNISIILFCYFI